LWVLLQDTVAHLVGVLKRLVEPENSEKHGFRVLVPDEDNLCRWHVELFGFDTDTQLCEDLAMYEEIKGRNNILVEVLFPPDYPNSPPFLRYVSCFPICLLSRSLTRPSRFRSPLLRRIVEPRFHQYTGHVTIGGSLCIEDLTRTGWNSENDLSTFLIMLRNLLVEGHALVDTGNLSEYTPQEAAEAFVRVAGQHGWQP
jgi:ubiquitin-conjugating enzyme E2 Q